VADAAEEGQVGRLFELSEAEAAAAGVAGHESGSCGCGAEGCPQGYGTGDGGGVSSGDDDDDVGVGHRGSVGQDVAGGQVEDDRTGSLAQTVEDLVRRRKARPGTVGRDQGHPAPAGQSGEQLVAGDVPGCDEVGPARAGDGLGPHRDVEASPADEVDQDRRGAPGQRRGEQRGDSRGTGSATRGDHTDDGDGPQCPGCFAGPTRHG